MKPKHLRHINISELNAKFLPFSPTQRIVEFYKLFNTTDVLVTSSFGTTSVMLLHLIQTINKKQEIHFVDTTFHFPETIDYKSKLSASLDLKITDILPDPTHNRMTREDKSWEKEAGLCCMVNKVITLDAVKVNYKFWMTGMMSYQTHFRSGLEIFEISGNHLKFHPLIDVTSSFWNYYVEQHNLPKHPLLKEGYGSVGCTHCTIKGTGRSGRWAGKAKTECGLHTKNNDKNTQIKVAQLKQGTV